MASAFSEDVWRGGFYELAMDFGLCSDQCLEEAVKAVWQFPGLQGCYLIPNVEPAHQQLVPPAMAVLKSHGHLYGLAVLPNGKRIACGTCLVQEEGGASWLDFYVPLGALGTAYDVGGYPFDTDPLTQEWREPMENWLAAIGQAVFAKGKFRLGLVGFEVSGTVSSHELMVSGVPAKRSIGYLYPAENTLTWYPTNQWDPSPQIES